MQLICFNSVLKACAGSGQVQISSSTSACDLGVNVDQLVTYAVHSNAAEPLVEVRDVFTLNRHCQQIVCDVNSKTVAFAQHISALCETAVDTRTAFRASPCLGVWMHKHHVPSAP